jgi:two-component system, LytTR family, response regulator
MPPPGGARAGPEKNFMLATFDRPQSGQNSLGMLGRLNGAMKIRTLIVDDQLLARELLRRMLKDEPDVEIVGMPASGPAAVEAINTLAPDLVFLDVQMPELDGFGVLAQINRARMPVIIFVTANDDFALRAFEVHALDYLVKPCTPDRFKTALQRARAQIQEKKTGEIHSRLNSLLEDVQTEPRQAARLAVKSEGRIIFLKLADIDWVEAADNYVKLHVGGETHLLRETMTALENKLPAERFLRISRSAMVNIEQIKELHPLFHGEYVVVLRAGARLTLTRGYRDKLARLGIS